MKQHAWQISKDFTGLSYAHRVHSQDIRHALCCNGDTNACLRTHGHNGVASITIGGNELNHGTGFLMDFKEINFMKVVYDEMFDHRFVLDINDPIASELAHGLIQAELDGDGEYVLTKDASIIVTVPEVGTDDFINYELPIRPFRVKGTDLIPFWRVDTTELRKKHPERLRCQIQHLEALSLVDYIPSSENFVKEMFELAQSVLEPYGIDVVESTWKETDKSTARYFGPVK